MKKTLLRLRQVKKKRFYKVKEKKKTLSRIVAGSVSANQAIKKNARDSFTYSTHKCQKPHKLKNIGTFFA